MADFENVTPMQRPGVSAASSPAPAALPATIAEHAAHALWRLQRRLDGTEKPIPLPWTSFSENLGGGLWPGCHYLVSGTGVGKTQFGLQLALEATDAGVPAAYVALELDALEITARVAALRARLPWSRLLRGQVTQHELDAARDALARGSHELFHAEFGAVHGWSYTEISALANRMRKHHPETDGPGSRPLLIVLDFLQVIGSANDREELRERIARAAYQCREAARSHGAAVLVVSSAARDKYGLLARMAESVGLRADGGVDNPDVLVGLGKESGELEYSADSVTVLVKGERPAHGPRPMLVVTAKGRHAGARWCSLDFDGFRFSDPGEGARGSDAIREDRLRELREVWGRKQSKPGRKGRETEDDGEELQVVQASTGTDPVAELFGE